MCTRLCALVVAGLLLAPVPAVAAPERNVSEARTSVVDAVLARLVDALGKLVGASEDDNGPTVDPDGLVPSPSSHPSDASDRPRSVRTTT